MNHSYLSETGCISYLIRPITALLPAALAQSEVAVLVASQAMNDAGYDTVLTCEDGSGRRKSVCDRNE